VITDAIRDQNVLRFGIEWEIQKQEQCFYRHRVEEIDKQEVLNSEKSINVITLQIILIRLFSPAVSSIDNVIHYSKEEKAENTICVYYGTNETEKMIAFQMMNKNTIGRQNQGHYKSSHSRDKLKAILAIITMYGTSYDQG
jgi:type I restriction enzyme R subunit